MSVDAAIATAAGRRSVDRVVAGRRGRRRRYLAVTGALALALLAAYALTLMVGNTFYGPGDVVRVIFGEEVKGASFTVGRLRLPRASLGVLAGGCFGAAGVTFQTMLRNPLASPDVIGISSGASAAAVIGIVVLDLGDTQVSMLALVGALATASVMYALASKGGFAGARLIMIGVGLAAMLQSVVAYVLSRAASWELQAAMQWLTGSLNGATWGRVVPLAVVSVLAAAVLALRGRDLWALRLGDDSAASLGVYVNRSRLLLMFVAVVILAFATASAGPIAFVAFMAGPIAARTVGPGMPLVLPAALVGALLVLLADLIGQNAFEHRYPVGVITGLLGAPYLLLLLIRINRSGGSL